MGIGERLVGDGGRTTAPRQFGGFPKAGSRFFADLAANNNAAWFHSHKADYARDLLGPMSELVIDLSTALAGRAVPLAGEPRRAIFRINRDVRFAKDKSPYKTNISAVLSKDGNKHTQGSLYLQIGLEGSLAALGFYALEPASLSAMRDAIVARPAAWRKTAASLATNGLQLGRDNALSRLPRGYEAEDVGDLADTLKLKSFVVSMPLSPASLRRAALVDQIADFAGRGLPLLAFGWHALA